MSLERTRDVLVRRGRKLLTQPHRPIPFTSDKDANLLLNDLEHYPHAFVLACVMNRQIKAEKAWLVPFTIKQRLGSFEFTRLGTLPLEKFRSLFLEPETLHRFPDVMATNFYLALQRIARQYNGDAATIWAARPGSATIVRRFLEFDGVGPKIATMAANVLVRDFKIPVRDKISIDVSPDVQVRRVFGRLGLIAESASNEELIYRARELNPAYPGVVDLSVWEIGREWCRPKMPKCAQCYMNVSCPTAAERGEQGAVP